MKRVLKTVEGQLHTMAIEETEVSVLDLEKPWIGKKYEKAALNPCTNIRPLLW